jgi:tRNA(Ile)-lysidine synthase
MHPVEMRLAAGWPPEAWQDVTVLLAVSGGADSVALLRAMRALKRGGAGRLVAAHVNHQLRGAESDADESFVVELCRASDIPCEVCRVPVDRIACETGDGIEAAARAARYDFLARTAARCGARYVATAHTADDQAETILHRILRGTGIGGLAGIARVRPLSLPSLPSSDESPACRAPAWQAPGDTQASATLIRPFLAFGRTELAAYLDDLGQAYRRDTSNDDLYFTRNRIRRELLPQLAEQFNPGVREALLRLAALADEAQAVIDGLVAALFERSVTIESPEAARLVTSALVEQPRYLIRELLLAVWRRQVWPLQSMGFAQWDLLAEMVCAGAKDLATRPRKQTFPGGVLAEAGPDALRLVRPS